MPPTTRQGRRPTPPRWRGGESEEHRRHEHQDADDQRHLDRRPDGAPQQPHHHTDHHGDQERLHRSRQAKEPRNDAIQNGPPSPNAADTADMDRKISKPTAPERQAGTRGHANDDGRRTTPPNRMERVVVKTHGADRENGKRRNWKRRGWSGIIENPRPPASSSAAVPTGPPLFLYRDRSFRGQCPHPHDGGERAVVAGVGVATGVDGLRQPVGVLAVVPSVDHDVVDDACGHVPGVDVLS